MYRGYLAAVSNTFNSGVGGVGEDVIGGLELVQAERWVIIADVSSR